MNKYEISVWNDTYDNTLNRYIEEKLVIIGSNNMTSQNRATSPSLKSNVNGTNVLTFTMYYDYIDTQTGERVKNPFVNLLVNERKIKAFWKDKWYDLIIKNISEDSVNHTFTYTCEDLYLTELSRTGFNLEFATELQNNIGTAQELTEKVLEGTDWQFLDSDPIYQETEEPVYEVQILNNFQAKQNPLNEKVNIVKNPALIYYSCAPAPDLAQLKNSIQFYYSGSSTWQQDQNDMLVINGNCYTVNDITWDVNDNKIATAKLNDTPIFKINFNEGLSKRFRAKRFVQSQKTIFDPILNRYVNVYTKISGEGSQDNSEVYGYQTTEYNDALAVVNLISNSSNFSNTSGWIGKNLVFKLSPPFNAGTNMTDYKAVSYLYILGPDASKGEIYKSVYNSGIQNNRQYIPNGFSIGEIYIFRIKVKNGSEEPSNYITNSSIITPQICSRTINHTPSGTDYFRIVNDSINGNWIEYKMECVKSCSYNEILSTTNPFGIFLTTTQSCFIEDIQFFKEIYGVDGKGNSIRINPNEMATQSVAQSVWRYYKPDQKVTSKNDLEYLNTSLTEWNEVKPVYNNFEKFGTIEVSQSNRFNILQTIAETFECWVKFIIEHDENGYIKYIDGAPCKYVQLAKEIGTETSINFVYGIDLKGVKREIKSSQIATKTIVRQNDNQFGKNGFCSIARSQQNYPKENFIYNFDYFINQGLLSRKVLNEDLYGVSGLAYYSTLHNLNSEYEKNLEELLNKKNELTKQSAMAKVYEQYLSASKEEKQSIEEDLIKLANATATEDKEAIEVALEYARDHSNNTKVVTLVNDRGQIESVIDMYKSLSEGINNSIVLLEKTIKKITERQDKIIGELTEKNSEFNQKYSRYIQEGTWGSEDYYDDDKYYLDALQVAYTSSRPQITYNIEILRISDIEEYASKVFNLGDICTIQDTEYFGYLTDGITPYKEKITISEITSYFDSPEKDTIKVQNYKTQFDDLFQRISAATQNLEFSSGKYARAANIINTDGTIKSSVIQSTFNSNADLVYGANNESAVIDNTGITVTNTDDAAKQVKVTSGGIFITADGGNSWKNAIRGDGITADVITAGSLNVENVTIYGKESPTFRWDDKGISAFSTDEAGKTNFLTYVRFDKYGLYGIKGEQEFNPSSESDIYNNASFGLTWSKFFLKNTSGGNLIEISTDRDIVVEANGLDRIIIGRVDPINSSNYGIKIWNNEHNEIFSCDDYGSYIAGWELGEDSTGSYKYIKSGNIQMRSNGTIGCFEEPASIIQEWTYMVTTTQSMTAHNLQNDKDETIPSGATIYVFSSYIGNRYTNRLIEGAYSNAATPDKNPTPSPKFQFYYNNYNYSIGNIEWRYSYSLPESDPDNKYHVTQTEYNITDSSTTINYKTYYTFKFKLINDYFIIEANASLNSLKPKYTPPSEFKWSIDGDGNAIFYDINAKGGNIAGWFIDEEKIYQTYEGTREGTIKTQLNSSGVTSDNQGVNYSIITDAINAAMATVGDVVLAGGLINGYNIALLAQQIDQLNNNFQSLKQEINGDKYLTKAYFENWRVGIYAVHGHIYNGQYTSGPVPLKEQQ